MLFFREIACLPSGYLTLYGPDPKIKNRNETRDDYKLKKNKIYMSGNICLPCIDFYKQEHLMLWRMQCRVEASKTDAILSVNVLISSPF